jgi:hypothetical protein
MKHVGAQRQPYLPALIWACGYAVAGLARSAVHLTTNKQAQIMRKAGVELGFSPASRTRVQVANERVSPFAWLQDSRADPDGLPDAAELQWTREPDPDRQVLQ